jgi:substrate-binding family protein
MRRLQCLLVAVVLFAAACSSKPPKPAGSAGPEANLPNTPVGQDVVIGFTYQIDKCGFDLSSFTSGFDPQSAAQAYLDYWSKHLDLHGHRLIAKFADDGGPFCPEKIRAAAVKLVEEDHAFAVISGGLALRAGQVGDAIAAEKRFHIGSLWEPSSYYQKNAPYAWTQWAEGSQIVDQLAGYLASRKEPQRVYGTFHVDLPQANQLNDELAKDMEKRGLKIAKSVVYPFDVGQANTLATNGVAQLQQAGVNTVILITDPLGPILLALAAQNQHYNPAWVVTSVGYLDVPIIANEYPGTEWKTGNVFGVSNLGPAEEQITGTPSPGAPYTKAFQEVRPNARVPDDIVLWYYPIAIIANAISLAGPNLSDRSFADAMRKVRIETAPGEPVLSYGPDRYGALSDVAVIQWDDAKKAYVFPEGSTRHQAWP